MNRIDDYVVGFYDGPHATPAEAAEGPIFLGIKNVTSDGRLDFSEIRHVSEQEFPKWTKRVKPQHGDVVFSYEATLHRYALIPVGFEGCLGRRMALIRPDPAKLNSRFLHFYLLSPAWRNQVDENIITGATVNRLPLTKVPGFAVSIPSLEKQERIASILSAYDDLIENNRRRIALLEEAARQLYKEWFVRFRFPGHEHVKIVNGAPEGWERKPVADLASFLSRGITPTYDEEADGVIINQKCIRDSKVSLGEARRQSKTVPAQKLVRKFDVLINSTGAGTLGRVAQNFNELENLTVDSHVTIVRPGDHVAPVWFGLSLTSKQDFIATLGRGATNQTELSRDDIGAIEFLLPNDALLMNFEAQASKIAEMIVNLSSQNLQLAKARNLLLPKLMSGAIAV